MKNDDPFQLPIPKAPSSQDDGLSTVYGNVSSERQLGNDAASCPETVLCINARVQEYARTHEIANDNPQLSHSSEVRMPAEILHAREGISQQNSSPLTTELRADHAKISKFLKDFRNLPKKLTTGEMRHIHWRISVYPETWLDWYDLESKNSAYSLKAKLRRLMSTTIYDDILALQEMLEEKRLVDYVCHAKIRRIAALIQLADDTGVFDKHARTELGRWQKSRKSKAVDAKRSKKQPMSNKSKRDLPNKLPSDWKEQISSALLYDPVVDLWICVGSRSVEVKTTSLFMSAPEQLMIVVGGSKLSKKSGQDERNVYPSMLIPAACRLAVGMRDIDFSRVNLAALRGRMGRISMRMWGVVVSPMCFRHDIMGRVKPFDGETGTIASGLAGHASSKTSSRYGTRTGRSRKGEKNPIVKIETSRPIRETRSMRYRTRDGRPKNSPRDRPKPDNDKK